MPSNAKELKIWMNGKLVSQAEAVLPVNSAAVFYATNVFEGLRAYTRRCATRSRAMTSVRTCTCTWWPT